MDTLNPDQQVTYHFYNTMTGEWAGTLPLRGVTYGDSLNQVGSFSGNVDLTDPSIERINWRDFTLPNYNSLIVDIGGKTHWGGIVCGRTWSFGPDGYQCNISGQTFWGWLSQVVQATDYGVPPYSGITGTQGAGMPLWNAANASIDSQPYLWDPMLIAAQILADSLTAGLFQNIFGSSFAIVLNGNGTTLAEAGAGYLAGAQGGPPTPSTNYISINFPYPSLQTVQAMLLQLTQLGYQTGFDASVDCAYQSIGNPYSGAQAFFNLDYPFRGKPSGSRGDNSSAITTTLDFTKALSYTFPEDGTSQAITVYETGGNQDIYVEQNALALPGGGGTDTGYPNTSRVFNVANMNSPLVTKLLQENANSDLVLFTYPPVAPTVTYDLFDPEAGFGGSNFQGNIVNKGDCVYVFMPENFATAGGTRQNDPRFPQGLGTDGISTWRAVTYAVTVADEGQSTIEWTLSTPPARYVSSGPGAYPKQRPI